jgi:hypothetical protein
MKNIIKYFYEYIVCDIREYNEKKSKEINTNVTYTIPPYQYNKIYAYPLRYVYY